MSEVGRRTLQASQSNPSTEAGSLSSANSSVVADDEDGGSGSPIVPLWHHSGNGNGFADEGEEYLRRRAFRTYKSTWLQQLGALTKRSFLVTLREPMMLKVRLFQTILIGEQPAIAFVFPNRRPKPWRADGNNCPSANKRQFMSKIENMNTCALVKFYLGS